MPIKLDLDLDAADVSALTSVDALTAFLARLGYPTGKRQVIPPDAIGLADSDKSVQHLELLSEDDEGFLRVIFAQLRSVTAKVRGDLVRAFGRQNQDYLLVLTRDFDALEFVLIEKLQPARRGPGADAGTRPQAKVFVVPRRWPQAMLRIVRRLTFTMVDGLQQYDKLKSVFDAAHYSGRYFQNRALFADHYLDTRLPEDPGWRDDPGPAFARVVQIMADAEQRMAGKGEDDARRALFEPLWEVLGFTAAGTKRTGDLAPEPDYRLQAKDGAGKTAALVYAWAFPRPARDTAPAPAAPLGTASR